MIVCLHSCNNIMKFLISVHFGTSCFGIMLQLYRGCPLSEVTLYCHDPVRTTGLVLYIERSNESSLRDVPPYNCMPASLHEVNKVDNNITHYIM